MKIFLVLHHEIMGTADDPRPDDVVFFACSSLERALSFIRSTSVDPWSWWEIQTAELDNREWPQHVGYYGLRGGKLSRPPYKKCVERFRKERRA